MKVVKLVRNDQGKLYSLTTDRKYATMKRYQNKVAPFFAFRTLEDARYSGMMFHGIEAWECETSEIMEVSRKWVLDNPRSLSNRDRTNWWRGGRKWQGDCLLMYAPTKTILVPDFTLEERVWP